MIAPETLARIRTKCSICRHENSASIDLSLATSVGVRKISTQFAVSEQALFRHKRAHLRPMLARRLEGREYQTTSSIVNRLESLYDRAIVLLDSADKGASLRDSAACIREVRGTLELIGKCLGEFKNDAPRVENRTLTLHLQNLSVDELRKLAASWGNAA